MKLHKKSFDVPMWGFEIVVTAGDLTKASIKDDDVMTLLSAGANGICVHEHSTKTIEIYLHLKGGDLINSIANLSHELVHASWYIKGRLGNLFSQETHEAQTYFVQWYTREIGWWIQRKFKELK